MRAIAALLLLIAALAGPASPAFGAITLPAAPAEEEPAAEQAAPLALDSQMGTFGTVFLSFIGKSILSETWA